MPQGVRVKSQQGLCPPVFVCQKEQDQTMLHLYELKYTHTTYSCPYVFGMPDLQHAMKFLHVR